MPADAHHAYIKSLMILIGGPPPIGAWDRWMDNLSEITGVGRSSLCAAWKGRWISKNRFVSDNTLRKLEEASEHAEQNHDVITFLEKQIAIWETDPDRFQSRIEIFRDTVSRLRRAGVQRDDARAAPEAAGFAAAAAKA